MIQVESPKIDTYVAIKKWTPVIESKLPNLIPYLKPACIMCEMQALNESAHTGTMFNGKMFQVQGIGDNSLIPLSLKVLSELNLENKNIQVVGSPVYQYVDDVTVQKASIHTYQVHYDLSSVDVFDGVTDINLVETALINKLTKLINSQLRKYDTIVIYMLVESLMTISEGTMAPRMCLKTRIDFKDRNSEPDTEYYVTVADRIEETNVILNDGINDQPVGSVLYTSTQLIELVELIESRSNAMRDRAAKIRQIL